MSSGVDWKGIVREFRLLAVQLQPARFFALYLLLLIVVIACVVDQLRGML
jgi:hypothetical protein